MDVVQKRIDCAPPRPEAILALRGVLVSDDAAEDESALSVLHKNLMTSFDQTLAALAEARISEGAATAAMVSAHIEEIESLTNKSRGCSETLPEILKQRLLDQIAELLPEGLSEEKLAAEVTTLVVKGDVREELDRLDAHIIAARELLSGAGPTGRKLDFLTQEI